MASTERKIEATLRVKKAVDELTAALEREQKMLDMSSTKKRRPLMQIRNMQGLLPLLKLHIAKRLAYYKRKDDADKYFPGHELY